VQKLARQLRASLVLFALLLVVAAVYAASSARPNSFPKPALDNPAATSHGQETAVLSGGCFWGIQAVYQHTRGVLSATAGYAGGAAATANYSAVSEGNTGHAESVRLVFDPAQITYGQILMIFFSVAHDPTELNKQGPDWGTQYRSAVFYTTADQKKIAEAYIAQLTTARIYGQKIVTQVTPLSDFYPAENYHQDYVRHHPNDPYIVINDLPKVSALHKEFPELYREQ
jgi:peptide-methionine (S)-S-oxide reductase